MAIKKPYVGQRVRLNKHGLYQIYGTTSGLQTLKNNVMTLTMVDPPLELSDGQIVYSVEVSDPEITKFLIDNLCFDPVDEEL